MARPRIGSLTPFLVIVGTALSSAGCAARPSASPAASNAPPASETPAEAPTSADLDSADAGGAGAEDTGGLDKSDDRAPSPRDKGTVTSTPSAEPDEESKPTSATRKLTTVAQALDAFEEDEIRLGELLGGRKATALEAGACGSICDALASMRRASDAICDLAGEGDPRCTKARGKLAGNEKKIEGRGCQCGT